VCGWRPPSTGPTPNPTHTPRNHPSNPTRPLAGASPKGAAPLAKRQDKPGPAGEATRLLAPRIERVLERQEIKDRQLAVAVAVEVGRALAAPAAGAVAGAGKIVDPGGTASDPPGTGPSPRPAGAWKSPFRGSSRTRHGSGFAVEA
jgi:hypothetical protein